MNRTKSFAANTKFAIYAGLPLTLSEGVCTAWDREANYGRPFDRELFDRFGVQCDEGQFHQAVEEWKSVGKRLQAENGVPVVLPEKFPEGTHFAEYEGVPVSELENECTAWDRPGGRKFLLSSFIFKATQCGEQEFREIVAQVNREKEQEEVRAK